MMLGDMTAAAGDSIGRELAPAGLGFITLIFGIGQSLGPAVAKTLYEVGVKGEFRVPAAAFQAHPSSFRPLHPYFQSKAVFGKKY
jgi:hypothetical protein